MADLTKHYLISGRVQGVGYRAYTHRQASELRLSGWVRNLNDGRVEALARGPEAVLLTFESRLRTGPRLSRVETLVCQEWNSATADTPEEFEVRKDGDTPCSEA